MVGYHYMLLILKYFKVYPNLNEVVSTSPNLIWAVAIYPNVYHMHIEWTSSTPDPSNSTQVWVKLSITQIWLSLLKFTQMILILSKVD